MKNGKLSEVEQPLVYYNLSRPMTTIDTKKIYLAPSESSSQVAALEKETGVEILSVKKDDWFLIRTPLGLTGWMHGGLLVHNCS